MHGEGIQYAYGFWSLVVINVALFAFFILSFMTPFKKREWRATGKQISCPQSIFTRKRSSMAYIPRRWGKDDGHHTWHKQRTGIFWFCNHVERLEVDPWCKGRPCDRRALRLCEASTVFRAISYHGRDAYPVAHDHNSLHVSCAALYLLPVVKERRG